MLVRDLLVVNPKDQVLILRYLAPLLVRDVMAIDYDTKLEPVLKEFRKGRGHMAIVRKTEDDGLTKYNVGVITLEDIIEEIL